MATEEIFDRVMAEVMRKIEGNSASTSTPTASPSPSYVPAMPEFVGTNPIGDTIGLVIPNVDQTLHEYMKIDRRFRSIGILGGRTGAGPHIFAADEAIKATNCEIVSIELPRDTQGGAGHGNLIVFGAEDVSDTRRAVEIALEDLERTFGDVYANAAGHIELQYTARAAGALNRAFGAPIGKAFGIAVGAPAAIGVVMQDTAVKAANVDLIGYASPSSGTSFSNEVIGFYTGDSGAVRQAIRAARQVGVDLLRTMGDEPKTDFEPYI